MAVTRSRSHKRYASSSEKKCKCKGKYSEENKIDKAISTEEVDAEPIITHNTEDVNVVMLHGENEYETSLLRASDSSTRYDIFKNMLIKNGTITNIIIFSKFPEKYTKEALHIYEV